MSRWPQYNMSRSICCIGARLLRCHAVESCEKMLGNGRASSGRCVTDGPVPMATLSDAWACDTNRAALQSEADETSSAAVTADVKSVITREKDSVGNSAAPCNS